MTEPRYIYRISPNDACLIECKKNTPTGKWRAYARRTTPQAAALSLLRIKQTSTRHEQVTP